MVDEVPADIVDTGASGELGEVEQRMACEIFRVDP
jgi:hypothetical protein